MKKICLSITRCTRDGDQTWTSCIVCSHHESELVTEIIGALPYRVLQMKKTLSSFYCKFFLLNTFSAVTKCMSYRLRHYQISASGLRSARSDIGSGYKSLKATDTFRQLENSDTRVQQHLIRTQQLCYVRRAFISAILSTYLL